MTTTTSSSFSSVLSVPQTVQAMLQACRDGNIENVQKILSENGTIYASQQDESTGVSPLMVAAEEGHLELCRLLLENGAPWNALDRNSQCAGNYATNKEHWDVVNLLVDHGTRAELILGASMRLKRQAQENEGDEAADAPGALEATSSLPVQHEPCTKPDYLRQRLQYTDDGNALLDADQDAVMMEWERPLMEAHASILMENRKHRRVLNVGFGMGIIDTALQKHNPSLHIIIEAHPDVHARMLRDKWHERPNVRICFGTWQEVMPQLISEGVTLDAVFYDTYGEHFMDLEDFPKMVVQVLSKPHGIYSFFNGLAPDNLFFHGVACQCVKLQVGQLGLDTEFIPCQIQVPDDEAWKGIRRKYWHGRDTYYLPRATWNPDYLAKCSDEKAAEESSGSRVQKQKVNAVDPPVIIDNAKRQKLDVAAAL